MNSLLRAASVVLVFCGDCCAQHVFEYLELGRGSSGEDLVSARLELAEIPASVDDIVSFEILGFQGFVFGDGQSTGVYDGSFDESIGEFVRSDVGGLTRSDGQIASIFRDNDPELVSGDIPDGATLLSLDVRASVLDSPEQYRDLRGQGIFATDTSDGIRVLYELDGQTEWFGSIGFWQPVPEPSSFFSLLFATSLCLPMLRQRA